MTVACQEPARRSASRLLAAPGELKLRVRGSGHDGRLIRIRSAKCTIGSAAGCTLRLRDGSVGPLHCWILRGPAGAVVRRLHGKTTLNGAALDEAFLCEGDRLRMGEVELEIVECSSQRGDTPPLPFPAPPSPAEETLELERQLRTARDRIHQLESESRQGFQSSIVAADRADQLRDGLSAAHEQLAEACRELAAAQETMSRQTEELDSYRRKLIEAEAEESELAAELQRVRQAAAEDERLARESEAVEAESRLTMQTQCFDAERLQLACRLQERENELAAAQEAIVRQTDELDNYRQKLSATIAEQGHLAERLEQARQTAETAGNERRARELEIAEEQSRLRAEAQRIEAERVQLERRLQQRDSELEAVRSTSTAKTGLMTIPMAGVDVAGDQATAEAQQQCQELQSKLAEQQSELETLRRLVGEQAIIEGRLENVTRDYAEKCAELAAAEARAVSAAEISRRQDELETRGRNLAQQEADLVERVAKVTEAKQQLSREREALALERQEIVLDQAKNRDQELHLEQQTADLERHIAAANTRLEELEALRNQLAGERAALDERAHRLSQRQRDLESKEAEFEQRWSQLDQRNHEIDERAARMLEHEQAIASQLAAIVERQCAAVPVAAEPVAAEPVAAEPVAAEPVAAEPVAVQELAAEPGSGEHPCPSAESSADSYPLPGNEALPSGVNVTAPWEPIKPQIANADSDPSPHMDMPSTMEDNSSLAAEPSSDGGSLPESNDVDRLLGRLVQAGLFRGGDSASGKAVEATESSTVSVRQSSVRQSSVRKSASKPDSDLSEPALPGVSPTESRLAAMEPKGDVESGDDESIECYMDRLLKRVRSASPAASATAPPAAPRVETAAPPAQAPVHAQPADDEVYVPRTTAPELPANLSAMRELANTAARTAIDQHVRKHTGRQAAGRLVAAGLTIATSVLLSYWAWRAHSLQAGVAAGIGGSVGMYWTFAALRRLFGAMRLSRPRPAQP